MTKKKWDYILSRSRERMAQLIRDVQAPNVIVANEARILLRAYHGGLWRAIRHWVWSEILRNASDLWFAVQVLWHRGRKGGTYDEAADVIVDRSIQREERKAAKHG